jgi:hypothetical protein
LAVIFVIIAPLHRMNYFKVYFCYDEQLPGGFSRKTSFKISF